MRALLAAQLGYAVIGLLTGAVLVATDRPRVLLGLPLVAGLAVWILKMTFEPDSPLVDPEHLYRRPVFVLAALGLVGLLVALALA